MRLAMKAPRQSTQQDILPSLFLQQTHNDPRNFAASVLIHFCVAALIAVALHRAVTNTPLLLATPFTPVHLSDPIFIPSSHAGTGGDTSGGSRHEVLLASQGVT